MFNILKNIKLRQVKRVFSGIIALIGFLLSPISWWNDILVNFPLSYLFAVPFRLLDERLFLPSFILGYWLTNIAGILMMHFGVKNAVNPKSEKVSKKELRNTILVGIFYTIVIVFLVLSGIIDIPIDLIERLIS